MPVNPTVLIEETEDSEMSWGASGLTRRRIFRMDGVTNGVQTSPTVGTPPAMGSPPDPNYRPAVIDWLAAALADPLCPLRGDKLLTGFGNLYCVNVTLRHVANQKTKVKIIADYIEIGTPINGSSGDVGTTMWLVGVNMNGTGVNINSSFDRDGSIIKVGYKRGVGNHPYDVATATSNEIKTNVVLIQYAQLPTLQQLEVIEYKTREVSDPTNSNFFLRTVEEKLNNYCDCINLTEWNGYDAGTVRLRMMVSEFDATRSLRILTTDGEGNDTYKVLWDVRYVFEIKSTGWNTQAAVLESPFTGYPMPDMEDPGPVISANADSDTPRTNGNGWCCRRCMMRQNLTT